MKKLILSGWIGLTSLCLPLVVSAQTYDWAMNVGGTTIDLANTVAVDGSNNVFTGGYFSSSPAGLVNFNPLGTASNLNATVNGDAYLAKYNSTGILQRAFKIGGTLDDRVNFVSTDASNNVYMTGYFKGNTNLDPAFTVPGSVAGGSGAIMIAKYNNALDFQWGFALKDASGSTSNAGYGIVADAAGDVYVTGSFGGTIDFDPHATNTFTLSSSGTSDLDIFVAKYSSTGAFIWAFNLGGTSSDIGYGIAVDGSSNVYITGKFAGTAVDFDPGAGVTNLSEFNNVLGSGDGFVAKYNSSGLYQWAFSIGGPLADLGKAIDVSPSGTLFVTGSFQGTSAPLADFDPVGTAELTSAGGTDMFVAGYTSSGTYIWSKRAGGVNDDLGASVTSDASGQAYVTGFIGGTGAINFGAESVTIVGLKDAFFAKYNAADGTNIFAKGIGGANDDTGGGIAVDGTSSILVVGGFNGTAVDFNPGAGTNALTTNGTSDIFNARYTQCAAPIISTQPTAQNVCPGSPATFTVVASGGTLSYQWKLGSTNVGTNSATLTIASPGAGDVGSYTVVVTNTCPASVTSSAVNLTLKTATAISTQPSFTGPLCTGGTLSLSVVATGTNLSYQWKQGSTNVGTNSSSYSKPSVTTGDNGSYTVVVTGDCGAVTSNATAVTVGATTAITTQPSFTGPVCSGSTLTLSVVATGSNLTYQWKQGVSNVGTNSATYTKASSTTGDNGSYTVEVTGDCGTVTSSATAVTISTPPSISTQPTAQNVCAGTPASFSVVASGSGTLSYQWKLGSTNVGTNSATYSIASAAAGDVGSYTVVVSNGCTPNATSSAVALSLKTATAITTQPSFVGPVCQSSALTLSVVATGANLSYQWKQGSTNVGSNSATYTQASSSTADNGSYTVVVTGDCGAVTSSATAVTISTPPTISTQPTAQNICAGTPASFTVVASGSGTLAYQWKLGSTNVGTNSASLNIASAAAGDVGSYTVVVSNGCTPNATSSAAALTLKTATSITTQPSFTGPVCQGSALTLSVVGAGTGTLSYQWKQGSTNVGTNSATYTKASSATSDDGSYTVVVTGDCGSVTSSATAVTISTPPVITTQPTNESICPASPVTFTVAATGTGLSYQWKKGSTNVGTNSSSYTIASPVTGDAGSYSVVITGTCAPAATSNTVTLSLGTTTAINTQPSFTGPVCQGSALSLSVVAVGNNLSYQWKQGSTNVGTNAATYTQASSSTADNGSYTVVVTGDCGTVTSSAAVVNISTPPAITTQPSAQNACPSSPATFTVVATGSGLSYQWVKGGSTNVGTNSATYTIPSVVAGDAANYTVVVSGTCTPAVTSNAAALTVGGSPAISTQPQSQSICSGSATTFSVVASGTGLTYQWKKGGVDIGPATASTYTIPTTVVGDAGSYTVSVSSSCGSTLSSAAILTVKTLPSITTQPQPQAVCDGSTLTISVLGSGSSLTYQWKKDGGDISGANSATYSVVGATAADAGSYTVLVSNGCAPDVLSNAAAVTINTLPAITVQPVDVSVCALGQAATFSVTATGTGISYVWKRGATIVGTDADTYTIASVGSGDIASYTVTVSGTCTPAVTSNAVSLSVSTATVTIVTQPVSQTLCIGDDLALVVTATGPSLSYQWKKGTTSLSDGGSVSGAQTNSLSISSVVSGDAGNYTCEITSGCASPATSNVAAITVNTCTGVLAQQGNMFYVSPNPGADQFYLNAEGIADGDAVITVMNTLGHEVWRGNVVISGGTMQQLLPVELSSGMYTVILSRGDNRYSTKMVVQK